LRDAQTKPPIGQLKCRVDRCQGIGVFGNGLQRRAEHKLISFWDEFDVGRHEFRRFKNNFAPARQSFLVRPFAIGKFGVVNRVRLLPDE
jgi:hypothetical protein